jgi:NAD(P)H-binding
MSLTWHYPQFYVPAVVILTCILTFTMGFNTPIVNPIACTSSASSTVTKLEMLFHRRSFLTSSSSAAFVAAASTFVASSPLVALADDADISAPTKSSTAILVLGGTGLVGSAIVKKLQSKGYSVISTSRDGRDGTVALNFSSTSSSSSGGGATTKDILYDLAKGCSAVISTVGAIGTDADGTVNAASGLAAKVAKSAGVSRFVYISVAPEVRELAKDFPFLTDYMKGKQFSEDSIRSTFPSSSITLIEPTFIYGGDKFGINPPRVATGYGALIESILSSSPLRAITNVAPEGFIKIALEPPISAEAVADAAIAGALGNVYGTLDTYDKIQSAAKTL